jgi:hypothetical protein
MRVCQFRHFGTERFDAAPDLTSKQICSGTGAPNRQWFDSIAFHPVPREATERWTLCNSRCYKGIHSFKNRPGAGARTVF